MNANILDAVVKLAAIKQLDKEVIQEMIMEAIHTTLSKKLEPENELEIFVEESSNTIKAHYLCQVVETESRLGEISLEEARKQFGRATQLGDFVPQVMAMHEFEPKLIKTAQKAIQDKICQFEEEKI